MYSQYLLVFTLYFVAGNSFCWLYKLLSEWVCRV